MRTAAPKTHPHFSENLHLNRLRPLNIAQNYLCERRHVRATYHYSPRSSHNARFGVWIVSLLDRSVERKQTINTAAHRECHRATTIDKHTKNRGHSGICACDESATFHCNAKSGFQKCSPQDTRHTYTTIHMIIGRDTLTNYTALCAAL